MCRRAARRAIGRPLEPKGARKHYNDSVLTFILIY